MIALDVSDTLNLELEACKVRPISKFLEIDCPSKTIAKAVLSLLWEWGNCLEYEKIFVLIGGQRFKAFTPNDARCLLKRKIKEAEKMVALEESGLLVPQSVSTWKPGEIFAYVHRSGQPWALSSQAGKRFVITQEWTDKLNEAGDKIDYMDYVAESPQTNIDRWNIGDLNLLIDRMGGNPILTNYEYRARLVTNEWARFYVHAQQLNIGGHACRLLSLLGVESLVNEI